MKVPIEFSKRNKRGFSPFFGESLLPEYALGILDQERTKLVQDYVKDSRDAELSLGQIQRAINYSRRLNDSTISQEFLEEIETLSHPQSGLRQAMNFENWSVWTKWGIESALVAIGVALVLAFVPWMEFVNSKLWHREGGLILAQLKRSTNEQAMVEPQAHEEPEFTDVGAREQKKLTGDSSPSSASPIAPQPPSPSQITGSVATSAPAALNESIPQQGVIIRGQVSVSNLGPESETIRKAIEELGGRKAGSVSLGWKKNNNTSYFHFTIPTAKAELLKERLKKYNQVSFVREKHPRIMPEGIQRYIIEVVQAPLKNQETHNEGSH